MLRYLSALAVALAPALASAEPAQVLRVIEEGPAAEWLPGNDGTGAAGVRIHRGTVPEIDNDTDVLPWTPNRPVVVSELPQRVYRGASRYQTRSYYYYQTYPRRRHHSRVRSHLKLDIGDVSIRVGHPGRKHHRKSRRHRTRAQQPQGFSLPN